MRDDLEINIKIIPVEEVDESEEIDERIKDEILNALVKSFCKGCEKEELEEVTTVKHGNASELPRIFERFGVNHKSYRRNNRYKHNKNMYKYKHNRNRGEVR